MTNPLEEYAQAKEAQRETRKTKEIALWKTWKDEGEQPHHLQPLLKLYEPNIAFKVKQWKAPTIPESAFKAELQTHLIKAFESFDPDRGVALNTHVENRLHKAKRYNAKNQNLAYIPEGQIGSISPIEKAKNQLSEELGRDPTPQEIADHVNETAAPNKRLTAKRVEVVQRAIRRDIPGSMLGGEAGSEGGETLYEEQQLEIAKNLLPHIFPNKPEFHTLFNYTFGTNGHAQILSTSELAKKMGKSQSQISRMKTQMGTTLQKEMGLTPGKDEG